MQIEISKINLKENTQSRVAINQNTVNDYAAELKEGAKFPPVILFQDGKNYFVGDGWHRLLAFKAAGQKKIEAEVKPGTKRDAVLYSVGSNATHGLRRTNEDKRKAVQMLLEDKEWALWSNREIAKKAVVSPGIVDKLRKEVSAYNRQMEEKKATRGGKEYTINTANIGQNAGRAAKGKKADGLALAEVTPEPAVVPVEGGDPFRKFRLFGWDIYIKKASKAESEELRPQKV